MAQDRYEEEAAMWESRGRYDLARIVRDHRPVEVEPGRYTSDDLYRIAAEQDRARREGLWPYWPEPDRRP